MQGFSPAYLPHVFVLILGSVIISSCEKPKLAAPATPPPPPPKVEPIPVSEPVVKPPAQIVRKPWMSFQLPTSNQALYTANKDAYFMFVDRSTHGVSTQVWEGGQYGFVRDPKMASDGSIVYSRFHEGMDVAPVKRDAKGEPLDEVFAIAGGKVAYANATSKSNYGNYVIIEHPTGDGPFYSLYAHLHHILVARDQKVACGTVIGIMGHTGSGIDRRRSHTHVELNLLLNPRLAIWQLSAPAALTVIPPPAAPGKPVPKPLPPPTLNGQNLVGLDISGWLLAIRQEPELKLSEFIHRSEPYFKIRTPCLGQELEIVQRYPWLRVPGPIGQAWEISIAASSLPLKIEPLQEKVEFTTVSWVQPFVGNHAWKSREMLSGSGSTATLSKHGQEYLKLLLGQ